MSDCEWKVDAALAALALIEQEVIAITVKAFGAGKIELPAPTANTPTHRLRFAPSFCRHSGATPNGKPYTAATLAKFLGMSDCEWKVSAALDTLACDHHHHQQKGIKTNVLEIKIAARRGAERLAACRAVQERDQHRRRLRHGGTRAGFSPTTCHLTRTSRRCAVH